MGVWIRVVSVRGVGLYLDPLVLGLLAFVLVGRNGGASMALDLGLIAIVLGSVLLHEVAHALMARRRGLAVGGIFLHLVPFAYLERGKPADELRVALAGPGANLLVAGVALTVFGAASFPWLEPARWLDDLRWWAIGLNLLMGLVNLLPALPADGGRALRAFLLMRMPPGLAYARTARVGTFVGAALLLVAVVLRRWPDSAIVGVLGVFLCMVAWREARAGQVQRRVERARSAAAE